MKYLLLALLISTNAYADRKGSPFHPHDDKRFDEIEDQLEDNTEAVGLARKSARFEYDVAVDGGSSTATKSLGVILPAGAVITSLYVYINTAFTDSGSGSVALQCAGTRDLMAYQDLTVVGLDRVFARVMQASGFASDALIGDGAANGGAYFANQVGASVPTACTVTAVVRGDDGFVEQTAGKLTGIIEYFSRD